MQYLVHHLLRDSAAQCPDQEALVWKAERVTYASANVQVMGLAAGLRKLGIQRGDRVAVLLRPSIQLPISLFAISAAGAVFVPIHHGMFPTQVAHILRDCGAVALITDGQRLQLLNTELPQLPTLTCVVCTEPADNPTACPTFDFMTTCQPDANAAEREECIEKDLAAILYTSGSTGYPKGVMLSHANLLAGARIVADYLDISSHDRILAALPWSFDAGLNQLTTATLQAGTTVMLDFKFGRDIVRQLAGESITGLAGVPSLWSLLAQPSSGLGKQPLPHLRYITNTGGAMPQNVLSDLRSLLPGTKIYLMYGLTEAFRSTYLPPEELDRRPTSMGRAIPNTEILVVNEQGERCQVGEVGELVHHGPTVSLGYWGHPELTERVLRPHPFPLSGSPVAERVCYSGDLVRFDEEGFLYFVGRRDNQIKSAGFRISPTEVEDVLCRQAGVRQAAVIGVPDPVLGQHLVAYVLVAEHSSVSASDLLAKCASSLPRHMVPKQIELVGELPMTASGKVNYPRLRELRLAACTTL